MSAAEHLQEAIDVGCTRDDHNHVADHRAEALAEAGGLVRNVAAQLGFPLDIVNMLCEDLDGAQAGKDTGGAPAGESTQPATGTAPLAIRWDRTVIHPDADPTDDTIVCCLVADTRQPVALFLDDEHREALGLALVEPDDPNAPAPDADDRVMRTVRDAIEDFNFAGYGLDDVDPTSEYAEWVGDLASAIAGALGGEPA